MSFALDLLLTVVMKLQFATACEKSRGLNEQSARQFPSWALFGFVALFVTAPAFGIAAMAFQLVRLAGA